MKRLPLWRALAWALARVTRERYRRARLGDKEEVDWRRLKRPARVPYVVVEGEPDGGRVVEIKWL